MQTQRLTAQRPADWVERALVTGLAAATAMLAAFLLAYVLAAFFAGVGATNSATGREMETWFRAVISNPLVDRAQSTLYLVVAAQVTLALVGAVVYALLEPGASGAGWVRGVAFALPVWLVSVVVVLPAAGAGALGLGLGAGPLPMLGSLLAYLVYGAVLGTTYGPLGDRLLGPETAEDVLAIGRTMRTGAGGLVAGLVVGGLAGAALSQALMRPGQDALLGLPPVALVLGLALSGAGVGQMIGSLAGLPTAPATAAELAAQTTFVRAQPVAPRAVPLLRELTVVAANGVCTRGYKLGDSFVCGPNGEVSPGLCPAATQALQPLLATMVQGNPDAPRQVACPVYDHMLVFQLNGAATSAA